MIPIERTIICMFSELRVIVGKGTCLCLLDDEDVFEVITLQLSSNRIPKEKFPFVLR